MKVAEKNMGESQAYEARAVVAQYSPMGHYMLGSFKIPIYRFVTLYQGEGREAIPVEFKRPAPLIKDSKGETFLNIEALDVGDFVVKPALIYTKCLWFDNLMAAHLKAVQKFKPKTIVVQEKSDAPAFDLGTIDSTTDQVTKQ